MKWKKSLPVPAENELLKTAGIYQTIMDETGNLNGKILFNQGNAYYNAGETGKAVLAYKRALLYSPLDSRIKKNLNMALEEITSVTEEGPADQVLKILFFFHYDIPGKVQGLIFLACFSAFWIIMILGYFKSGALRFSIIPLVPALIFGLSLT